MNSLKETRKKRPQRLRALLQLLLEVGVGVLLPLVFFLHVTHSGRPFRDSIWPRQLMYTLDYQASRDNPLGERTELERIKGTRQLQKRVCMYAVSVFHSLLEKKFRFSITACLSSTRSETRSATHPIKGCSPMGQGQGRVRTRDKAFNLVIEN